MRAVSVGEIIMRGVNATSDSAELDSLRPQMVGAAHEVECCLARDGAANLGPQAGRGCPEEEQPSNLRLR